VQHEFRSQFGHPSSCAFVRFECAPADDLSFESRAFWPSTVSEGDRTQVELGIAEAVADVLLEGVNEHSGCAIVLVDVRWDDVGSSVAAFMKATKSAMQQLVAGDPMDPGTQLGPLATPAILDELDAQVHRSGGRVLTGGHRLDRPGNYYAPTVLTDVPAGFQEELFGPVAVLYRARDLDDAIRIANDTPFGLGASVWTRDAAEQRRLIDEIESGMVFVNAMVASDPRLPFGGIKASGYGRELSAWGIREFVSVKTVVLRK